MKDTVPSWEELCSDLILESTVHSNNKRKPFRESGSVSNVDATKSVAISANKATATKNAKKNCSGCGKQGHVFDECLENPLNPKYRLSIDKKQALLTALNGQMESSKDGKKVQFGKIATGISTLQASYAGLSAADSNSTKPCLDNGASRTFFRRKDEAVDGTYKQGNDTTVETAAGSKSARCLGQGTLKLGNVSWKDSLHVQRLNTTLISVPQICDMNKIVVFTKNESLILDISKFEVDESIINCLVPRNKNLGLYNFKFDVSQELAYNTVELSLLHKRYMHANERVVRKSIAQAKGSESYTPPGVKGKMSKCHPCAMEKATRLPFKSSFEESGTPGEIIHSDVDGPLPPSLSGSRYLCTFVDQATRHITIATFPRKSDVETALAKYKASKIVQYFPKGI